VWRKALKVMAKRGKDKRQQVMGNGRVPSKGRGGQSPGTSATGGGGNGGRGGFPEGCVRRDSTIHTSLSILHSADRRQVFGGTHNSSWRLSTK
jgi:hypothetical protein